MLYLDKVVPVPESGVTKARRGHDIYVKKYIDSWKNEDGSRNTNRKQPIIGKLTSLDDSCKTMYPNDKYYELYNLPKPTPNYSKVAMPGRKSDTTYEKGMAVYPSFALLCASALINCGAYDILIKYFGEDLAHKIIFLATHYASGRTSLESIDFHAITHNIFEDVIGINSRSASELLASGIKSECIRDFFCEWIPLAAKNDAIAYDVTSLSTKAKNIIIAERGYSHGGSNLPQVNYVLLANTRTGLPLFFTYYNGSITDKQNLKFVIDSIQDRNLPGNITMVFDRGFASYNNIVSLRKKNIGFIMGLPATFSSAYELLEEFNKEFEVPYESMIMDLNEDGTVSNEACRSKTCDFEYKGERLRLHLYRNETRHHELSMKLNAGIKSCQIILEKTGSLPESSYYKEALSCFYKKGKKWLIDNEIYQRKLRNYGSFALISSYECNYSSQEALYLYRSREIDEEIFRCLKSDLNMVPMRVWKDESLSGKFFVLFISAIIRRYLLYTLKDILTQEHASFNRLVAVLEHHKSEVRGDGSICETSVKDKFHMSVMAEVVGYDTARILGLKDYYIYKPKRRATRKEMEIRKEKKREKQRQKRS